MLAIDSVRLVCFIIVTVLILSIAKVEAVEGLYGQAAGEWKVAYESSGLHIDSKHLQTVNLVIYDVDLRKVDFYFAVRIKNQKLAFSRKIIPKSEFQSSNTTNALVYNEPSNETHATWHGSVNVQALYFGYTYLYVTLHPKEGDVENSQQTLNVTVTRANRLDNKVFSYSAASLILLMFINLGTALDLKRLKLILLKPIGPLIGCGCRYILMPSVGLGLGFIFLPSAKELQLALFLTALSPSGGLANICTVFLKGNINLSIATTTINSLLALAMLPLWIFFLARKVYNDSTLSVPLIDLGIGSVALILALALGITLRYFLPKTTSFLIKFIKPLSVILSLCLIALTVAINAFAFKELTWNIFVGVLLLPIIGYLVSFTLSKILYQSSSDSLTIAIETSVLNMTLPIVLLQHSLEEPKSDMAVVVPVVAALTSLFLIVVLYIVRSIFGWNVKSDIDIYDEKPFLVN